VIFIIVFIFKLIWIFTIRARGSRAVTRNAGKGFIFVDPDNALFDRSVLFVVLVFDSRIWVVI
jgi:hypothetical protein